MKTWYLVIVGFSFILWADAICDFFKLDMTPGTFQVLGLTTVILIYAYLVNKKKVKKIMKEQLGD